QPALKKKLVRRIEVCLSKKPSIISWNKAEEVISEYRHTSGRTEHSPSALRTDQKIEVVGVAISTGGPNALSRFIPTLPQEFSAPVLVVQHIIPGFIEGIVRRLDSVCDVRVKIAEQDEALKEGTVYFAPDRLHLRVKREADDLHADLGSEPSGLLFCPSADVLFNSMAENCGNRCIGVIMTGMGHDGVVGLGAIKKTGGITIAQDRESSAIYGMARVAVDAKIIDSIVPLEKISGELDRFMSTARRATR
ncbi:MAG TPA: CheB methylesterase domain-containing protein, partial [bacterium]|nr:CheB methylesterase domain-containing protein [bacterium]